LEVLAGTESALGVTQIARLGGRGTRQGLPLALDSSHADAADLLSRVDKYLGSKLRDLVDLKPGSHNGDDLLAVNQRTRALRAVEDLVTAARQRTT
jgi:hypothetical protein